MDGAGKGNLGRAGCGGVLRDEVGNFIDAIAIPIGISNSHIAEATAALYTIKLVVDLGYSKLWLEGDSLNIINTINNKNEISWSIEATVMEIKTLIQKFEKVVISHTYREVNGVDDWIANYVVQMRHKVRWHEELNKHADLKVIINYEAIHSEVGKICFD